MMMISLCLYVEKKKDNLPDSFIFITCLIKEKMTNIAHEQAIFD